MMRKKAAKLKEGGKNLSTHAVKASKCTDIWTDLDLICLEFV